MCFKDFLACCFSLFWKYLLTKFERYFQIKICSARILDPTSTASSDNVIKVTAGLIAAIPFLAEIDNLRESQRLDLRMRIKYPDQNVHLMVPKMRDLKRILTENGEESK